MSIEGYHEIICIEREHRVAVSLFIYCDKGSDVKFNPLSFNETMLFENNALFVTFMSCLV